MGRPVLEYFEYVLETNWEPAVTGRTNDVPQPQIHIAGDVDVARVNQQADDVIFIVDGGGDTFTPRSVGWSEKRAESLVTLDCRTPEDRVRLEGGRDSNNNAERYGGLQGECERILDSKRKGDKEFDWIDGYEWRDLSEEVGYGSWRGTWEVRLTEIARNIDPSV